MQKLKNSKKGFSLPMAMAISVFLVIISTALIFIALQSLSTTSVDISGRQAYLNVRSALEYSKAYYSSNVKDYSKIKNEVMIMKDPGGTINEGSKIATSQAEIDAATTYVIANYTAAKDQDSSKLTLSAYSKYSDAFGNKGKMARLSVTFTVGGTGPNRLTIIQSDRRDTTAVSTDSITLNVKKPAGMKDLVYYVWTYKDSDNAYSSFYEDYETSKGGNSYDYDGYVKGLLTTGGSSVNGASDWDAFVSKMNNATVDSTNKIEPNAEWISDDSYLESGLSKGPNGVMSSVGASWYTGEYFIKSGRVPWFNIIFATQNSTLTGSNGANKIYDTQTCEIFHLWYLDPGDKNIYFEFFDTLKKDTEKDPLGEKSGDSEYTQSKGGYYYTKYYRGYSDSRGSDWGWDGKLGLEDTVLVYVHNPKTTIHFRDGVLDPDKGRIDSKLNEAQKPVIDYVEGSIKTDSDSYLYKDKKKTASNIKMEYEGCGWWVANIETNDTFNMAISFNGMADAAKVYNIPANTENNEFWLVYTELDDGMMGVAVCDSENDALNQYLTDSPDSYVTVHAKIPNYTQAATPTLIYKRTKLSSSPGRLRLLDAIVEAWTINEDDYDKTKATFTNFKKVLGEAVALEKDEDFIETRPGTTDSEKIKAADEAYDAKADELDQAIRKLEPRKLTQKDKQGLIALVDEIDAEITSNKDNYEAEALGKFTGSTNPEGSAKTNYQIAKEVLKDSTGKTVSDIQNITDNLQADYDDLKNNYYLDRGGLSSLIAECDKIKPQSKDYDLATDEDGNKYNAVDAFNTALSAAKLAVAKMDISKSQFDAAYTGLENAKNVLELCKKTVLKTEKLKELINDAQPYAERTEEQLEDCTAESHAALVEAYNNAKNKGLDESQTNTQPKVDAYAKALEDALHNYTVDKPHPTISEIASQGKIRVWVYYNEADDKDKQINSIAIRYYSSDTNYQSEILASQAGVGKDAWGGVFYYCDIDTAIYSKVSVVTITKKADGTYQETESEFVNFADNTDNNIAFTVAADGKVTASKLVTVYGDFEDGDVVGQIGGNMIKTEYEAPYWVSRYVYKGGDELKKVMLLNTVIEGVESKLHTYLVGILKPGEYIATPVGENKTTKLSVDFVYPKYSGTLTPVPENEPEPEPTDYAYEELEVGLMKSYADSDYIFFTDNDNGFGTWGTIYAYFFNGSVNGSTNVGASWPGVKMEYYRTNAEGQKQYMALVPSGATDSTKVVFHNNVNNGERRTYETTVKKGYQYWKTTSDYIYFVDNDSQWSNVKAFFKDNNDHDIGSWPGTDMTYWTNYNGNNIWRIQKPSNAKIVIFNRGSGGDGNQTKDYWIGENTFYRRSGFDGDGQNKFITDTGNSVHNTTTYTDPGMTGKYVYFTNKQNWEYLHVTFKNEDGTETVGPAGGYLVTSADKSSGDKNFKVEIPKGASQFVITGKDSSNHDVKSKPWGFSNGSAVWIGEKESETYKLYSWDEIPSDAMQKSSSGGTTTDPGTATGGTTTDPGVNEADLTGDGQARMAYVGGYKVRVTNESYVDLYGNSKNNSLGFSCINSDNKFGGSRPAGDSSKHSGNDNSFGRLGMAKLEAYYDWYDFKIPIPRNSKYSFSVMGLVPSKPSAETKIVEDAHGSVWLEMLSDTLGSGMTHYTNYNLYTFDPELKENDTGATLSVYFRKPNNWTNVEVRVTGPFNSEATASFTAMKPIYDGSDIYCLSGIGRNTPFVTFNALDEEGNAHNYVTELQGGDKVLYVPNTNYTTNASGTKIYTDTGEWSTYVSEQERLNRNVIKLRSAYYGNTVVSQYNDHGELASGAQRYYSKGLLNAFKTVCSNTVSTGGDDYFITQDYTKLNAAGDAYAYTASYCRDKSDMIERVLEYYLTLFSAMNSAKQVIADPLTSSDNSYHGDGGGYYPEYLNRSNPDRTYTSTSIGKLKKSLANAEKAFVDGDYVSTNSGEITYVNVDSIKEALNSLKISTAGLETNSEGSIAIVLFDAQGKVKKNSSFKIKYKLSQDGEYEPEVDVKDYNPERYPIIFLNRSDLNYHETIYDVQFIEIDRFGEKKTIEVTRPKMEMDEAWVFVYKSGNPYWSKNTATDYREIRSDTFVVGAGADAKFEMEGSDTVDKWKRTGPYKPMTLLFTKDAEVKGNGVNYIIKAGSYTFTNDDTDHVTKPNSPISEDGVLDLLTENAQTYFTDSANIGKYEAGNEDMNGNSIESGDVLDVSELWKDEDGNFVTVSTSTPNAAYANFEGNSGSMVNYSSKYTRYEFNASKGISFRWSSENPLYTSAEVRMHAKEIIFATMGTIDGTKSRGSHFYLGNYNAKSMIVDFRTDVFVKYVDGMGEIHSFAIREGKYLLEPAEGSDGNYVADLYDETYWKSMEHVKYIGSGITANTSGSTPSGELTNGHYD